MTRLALALVLAAITAGAAAVTVTAPVPVPAPAEWDFHVSLDGRPIGEHRFSLGALDGGERTLRSEAEFAVKILGITAYRYRHRDTEQWQGDCLQALTSTTDDDGKHSHVSVDHDGVLGEGCLMSFAYWNPAILTQTRLFNAQTGRIETVRVQPAGGGTLAVHGAPVTARRYRIVGAAPPIDVWYAPNGDWIGLDAVVAGGRKLSYRLP
ncbi:MAG TPA: DUF6134 family protein [Burkholderiaceae bacterium]|jgi:hypothetical protein